MNTYDIGDRVVVMGDWRNRANVAVDPDTVSVRVKRPDRTTVTYVYGVGIDVVRIEAGHYELEIDVTMHGVHHYYWWSTGNGKGAAENSFEVRTSDVLESVP
jgi:signal peptidase I